MALTLTVGTAETLTIEQLHAALDDNYLPYDQWSWEVLTGDAGTSIPDGMTVTGSQGSTVFSGTPTTPGDFALVLQYTDDYNSKSKKTLTGTVLGAGGGDPEPEPGEVSQAAKDVAALMGTPGHPEVEQAADAALPVITAMARSYTRDVGFPEGVPNENLAAVIQTATARFVANPDQVSSTVGGVTIGAGFSGWSLAELVVLNRYRKRAH